MASIEKRKHWITFISLKRFYPVSSVTTSRKYYKGLSFHQDIFGRWPMLQWNIEDVMRSHRNQTQPVGGYKGRETVGMVVIKFAARSLIVSFRTEISRIQKPLLLGTRSKSDARRMSTSSWWSDWTSRCRTVIHGASGSRRCYRPGPRNRAGIISNTILNPPVACPSSAHAIWRNSCISVNVSWLAGGWDSSTMLHSIKVNFKFWMWKDPYYL